MAQLGPQEQCYVSERVSPEPPDTLEAFQVGLVHVERAQHWPKEASSLGVLLLALSFKTHRAWETPKAIPWVEMVRRRKHYSVLGSGGRVAGRKVIAVAGSTRDRTLWAVARVWAPSTCRAGGTSGKGLFPGNWGGRGGPQVLVQKAGHPSFLLPITVPIRHQGLRDWVRVRCKHTGLCSRAGQAGPRQAGGLACSAFGKRLLTATSWGLWPVATSSVAVSHLLAGGFLRDPQCFHLPPPSSSLPAAS